MEQNWDFAGLLRLIDERSVAFRGAVTAAPGLERAVPTCPGWTVLDLAEHLGQGQRKWAAAVSAGPAAAPPAEFAPGGLEPAPRDREALTAWFAESTEQLLNALREAGPDRGCWMWWGDSQSPQTSGAVARHRVQEVAVHTYDAQIASGAPQPLPGDVALDGVDEFLATCCATTTAWPHKPAVLDVHAAEGHSWRISLSADGARITRPAAAGLDAPVAAVRGAASELVLMMYQRIPIGSLPVDGDRHVFDLLQAWDPSE